MKFVNRFDFTSENLKTPLHSKIPSCSKNNKIDLVVFEKGKLLINIL